MEPDADQDRLDAIGRAVWLAVVAVEVFYILDVLTGGGLNRRVKEQWYAVVTPIVYRWRLERQVRREAPHVVWEAMVAKEDGA